MLEYQTVRLSTVELSIQVGKQEVQELRDNIILDTECITNIKCIVGVHTYLVLDTFEKCKLKKIRSVSMPTI